MNIEWVKLPALFWGIEAVYHRVGFETAFKHTKPILKEWTDFLETIHDEDFLNTENFLKLIKRAKLLKNEIKENESWLKFLKITSTMIMLSIPFLALCIICYNSACYILPGSNPYLFSFSNVTVFLYSLFFLVRVIVSVYLTIKPIIKNFFLKRECEKVQSMLSPELLKKKLSPVTTED